MASKQVASAETGFFGLVETGPLGLIETGSLSTYASSVCWICRDQDIPILMLLYLFPPPKYLMPSPQFQVNN